MLTLADIRRFAMALPETEETTHFRLPTFTVRGKPFAGVERSGTTAIVSVDRATAQAAAAEDAETCEEVRRAGGPDDRIFAGLRPGVGEASAERLGELIAAAWRHRAPKRVVAAYDAGSGTDGGS